MNVCQACLSCHGFGMLLHPFIQIPAQQGARIASHGADAAAQRGYLLGYCHHQLGVLLQKQRDFAGAAAHHRAALAHGGADFAHAPDAHFNLAVISVLGIAIDGAEGGTDAERLVRATSHFKARQGRVACWVGLSGMKQLRAGIALAISTGPRVWAPSHWTKFHAIFLAYLNWGCAM
eukprot:363759-Chlamydomonas_euryale.AAC.27